MGCRVASSTTVGWCGLRKAWSQNATARGVSRMGTPTAALNHCRSASRKFTTAMGALHSRAASKASWSKESSCSVSRIAYSASARSLAASVEGRGGDCKAAMVRPASVGVACGVSAVVDQKNSPAWNGLGPAREGWTSSGALGANATPCNKCARTLGVADALPVPGPLVPFSQ